MSKPISKAMLTSLTTAALSIPGIALAEQKQPQTKIETPIISPKVLDSQNKETPKTETKEKEGGGKLVDANGNGKEASALPTKKNFLSWTNGKDIISDFKYTYYDEKGPRYKINVWQGLLVVPINDFEVRLNLQRDSQSGASPYGPGPEVYNDPTGPNPYRIVNLSSGPTIVEDLTQVTLTTSYYADKAKYSLVGFYATEDDTTVGAGSAKGEWYFNKNNTVLKASIGGAWENVKASQIQIYSRLNGKNNEQKYFLALKQDLTKYNYVQVSGEYQHFQGFLRDPYKISGFYGDASSLFTPPTGPGVPGKGGFYAPGFFFPPGVLPDGLSAVTDGRPKHRDVFLPVLRFVQYVPWTKGSLHFDYRYAADSWKLNSNMFSLAYYQPLPKGWQLEGRMRYYSQNHASFYAPNYNIAAGPSPFAAKRYTGGAFSSDYRLSGYGTMNYEVKLSYQVVPMMNISILGGYYNLRASYKMGSKDPLPNPELTGKGLIARYVSAQFDFKF